MTPRTTASRVRGGPFGGNALKGGAALTGTSIEFLRDELAAAVFEAADLLVSNAGRKPERDDQARRPRGGAELVQHRLGLGLVLRPGSRCIIAQAVRSAWHQRT